MQTLIEIDRSILDLFNGSDSLFVDNLAVILTSGLTWIPLYLSLLYIVIKNNETMKQIMLVVGCVCLCMLISDGGCSRYQILFETLRHCSGEVPELLLYPQVAEILHPALLKRFRIHYMDDTKIFEAAGKNAAVKLKRLMQAYCRKGNRHDKKNEMQGE